MNYLYGFHVFVKLGFIDHVMEFVMKLGEGVDTIDEKMKNSIFLFSSLDYIKYLATKV